jgi:formylglycine-generating enzyme required for sulfatase activity
MKLAQRLISCAAALCIAACSSAGEMQPTSLPPTPTPKVLANADWQVTSQTYSAIPFVRVPAGCFTMGNHDGRRDERPEHQTCFTSDYWITQTEITNLQFGSTGNFQGDQRPRENLTWFEARDFCQSQGWRLPTEAEWEYVARGPDSLIYPWGNELITDNLIFDQNSNNQTFDVASRPAGVSWVGAYDMSGNVYEWTNSIYRPYPYGEIDGREDASNTTDQRVYRSGWGSYIDFGVSAPIRFRAAPETRDWFIGFRCAFTENGGE